MRTKRSTGLLVIAIIAMLSLSTCGKSESGTASSTDASTESSVADISSFKTSPTDQFLMSMDLVTDAHSYRGKNSKSPHAGGHLHLNNAENAWPSGGTAARNYPPIYAIADGVVTKRDNYYKVGDNYRYGISLKIATKGGEDVNFMYSIEPMTNPGDETFYEDYIVVSVGDEVKKGDIIGYFYLVPNDSSDNAHIHFHMNYNSGFLAPCIFTDALVSSFHAKFGVRGTDDGDPLPDAMCYKLSADENPFESVAVETL